MSKIFEVKNVGVIHSEEFKSELGGTPFQLRKKFVSISLFVSIKDERPFSNDFVENDFIVFLTKRIFIENTNEIKNIFNPVEIFEGNFYKAFLVSKSNPQAHKNGKACIKNNKIFSYFNTKEKLPIFIHKFLKMPYLAFSRIFYYPMDWKRDGNKDFINVYVRWQRIIRQLTIHD